MILLQRDQPITKAIGLTKKIKDNLMQTTETLKSLIEDRSRLHRSIAEANLHKSIASQRKDARAIVMSTDILKDLWNRCKELDRSIFDECYRLGLPEQFGVVAEEGDRIHTVLLDFEMRTVAVFRTITVLDALVEDGLSAVNANAKPV